MSSYTVCVSYLESSSFVGLAAGPILHHWKAQSKFKRTENSSAFVKPYKIFFESARMFFVLNN